MKHLLEKCLRTIYNKILTSMDCPSSPWSSAAAFCMGCYPARGPYGGVLGSHYNWKGNSQYLEHLMSYKWRCRDVFKFLAIETDLVGTNLDF